MPRFFCPAELHIGELLELPAGAARHVQVLRLQPGDRIVLFNHGPGWNHVLSPGGEFEATITRMGRSEVQVMIGQHQAHEREAARSIHLAVGMPANDRMDWLVEKATEIGVTSIQPLMGDRSVLRLTGERAVKKVAHWQSVATAACEQCGGNRVPHIHAVTTLDSWLKAQTSDLGKERFLLSLSAGSCALNTLPHTSKVALFLSGPEGGWSPAEEASALACGFTPVSLGPRVLRSETAALVALTALLSRE